MSVNDADPGTRLYFLDWLRVLVILTLIPFHAALTYSGLGDTYIISPLKDIRIIPFILIVTSLSNFFMTLLFFVSGIASFYSLQNKGVHQYVSERRNKLLIPLGLGTLFLCPLQAYFKALYEGFSGNLIAFIPEFFMKIFHYMGYAHLWFLLYLYVFSMICIPLFTRWKNKPHILNNLSGFLCHGHRILIPMAFIILVEVVLRPFFPGAYIIIGDWANDLVYLSSFIFGYVYASKAEIQEKIKQYFKTSVFLAPICVAALSYTFWMSAIEGASTRYMTILWVFAKGIYECAAIVLLLGLGQRFLNKKSPVLSYLNKASFSYYLFHFIPVSLFTYLFIRTNMNVFLKYILVVLLSYLFIFIVYEFFVKRLTDLPGR